MLMGNSIFLYSSEAINSAQYEGCKNSKACHCLAPLGLALIDHIMENRRVKYSYDPWCHRHVAELRVPLTDNLNVEKNISLPLSLAR